MKCFQPPADTIAPHKPIHWLVALLEILDTANPKFAKTSESVLSPFHFAGQKLSKTVQSVPFALRSGNLDPFQIP